jgi:hypothetical protein
MIPLISRRLRRRRKCEPILWFRSCRADRDTLVSAAVQRAAGWRVKQLEIYVTPDCLGCETARRLAESVYMRAKQYAEVRVIDLSVTGAERPSAVFAVPTYLLDGRVISLGNPDEAWLIAQLTPPPDRHAPRSRRVEGGD